MRILIATGIFPPELGGPATYVPAFAAACVRRGHSVHVVTYGNPFLPASEPYPVSRVPRLFLPIRYFLFFASCLFRGFSADVFFAQDAFSSGLPASCAAYLLRKRLVVKIVGDFSWEYARNSGTTADTIDAFQGSVPISRIVRAIRFFQYVVCRQASSIIVPSAYLQGIVRGWGIDSRHIRVIHNAVPPPSVLRAADPDPFFIFSAGRLVSWKGFDGLIRAFAAIRPSFPRARLMIAGDGPCRATLESCAGASGVSDAVSFPGALSPAAITDAYRRAGCFALFSSYEGLPHVLLEALSYDIPVIASDVGGTGELIESGINGILVPSGDEGRLADALIAFFRDPRTAVPRPGFAHDTDFTWNALIERTIPILQGSDCSW